MRWMIAVAVIVFAGCGDSPTEPDLVGFEFFRDQVLESSVTVQAGTVLVEGTIATPCIPYEAHGQVAVQGRTLTLAVIGEDEDGNCAMDAIDQLGYRAVVRPPSGGEWTVVVVHSWADAGFPEEHVLSQVVNL